MSGICGIIDFSGAPVEGKVLSRMAKAASYRGPDGIRYWTKGNIGFAHLALNITPESVQERQPIVNQAGNIILSADVRLDNRRELISDLTDGGWLKQEEPGDAELIMAAYLCWGSECAEHLLGDFAFGLWDGLQKRFFAARDAMAMRAFYYRVEPQRLLFTTEVKQILAVPGVPVNIFEYIDRYHYLCYKPLPGAKLRYFVKSREEIVALFGFGAAAWKTAPRDHFIGWNKEQRENNIHLVVNNARFLILPWITSHNLASRLLSMVTKRLPCDWYNRYKYKPVLLESFVDQEKFKGTCYKASNWIYVGQTKGLGKVYWGRKISLPKKNIYLYHLKNNFKQLLCS